MKTSFLKNTILILCLSAFIFSSRASAQDSALSRAPMLEEKVTVTVTNPDSTRGVSYYSGRLLRFDRKGMEILTQENQRVTILPQRIAEMEFPKNFALESAEREFSQNHFTEALGFFQEAQNSERRPLVRAMIREKIVRCYRNLGKNTEAVTEFLRLAEEFPEMPDEMFSCVPLVWEPDVRDTLTPRKAAEIYRQTKTPIVQLFYGSYLLSSAESAAAVNVLKTLTKSKDIRLATLAETQLWRSAEPRDLNEKMFAEWESTLERIPVAMRGGPSFVLGKAYARTGDTDRAVLAFLKAATVYHQDAPFSAEALREAAELVEEAGHAEEAEILRKKLLGN